MELGLFTVLFQNLPFEQALDRAMASGVSAVEIGTGGYPGNHHCPLEALLQSSERRAGVCGCLDAASPALERLKLSV